MLALYGYANNVFVIEISNRGNVRMGVLTRSDIIAFFMSETLNVLFNQYPLQLNRGLCIHTIFDLEARYTKCILIIFICILLNSFFVSKIFPFFVSNNTALNLIEDCYLIMVLIHIHWYMIKLNFSNEFAGVQTDVL